MKSTITIRNTDRRPRVIGTDESGVSLVHVDDTRSLQIDIGSLRVFISSDGAVDVDATGGNTMVFSPGRKGQVRLEVRNGLAAETPRTKTESDPQSVEQHLVEAVRLLGLALTDDFDTPRLTLARTKAQEALLWYRSDAEAVRGS